LSVDWRFTYRTIGPEAGKPSQSSFLRLFERGLAYRLEAPTLWDVDFKSAIAQAELQDREIPGAYHQLRFRHAATGDPIVVDTTRPELVAACVALVAHPDDGRYRRLIGQEAVTPLFRARVPIVAHELADPEKGTGIAMICTFGDTTDITWWRELGLPVRATVERDGTMRPVSWGEPGWESDDPGAAQAAYNELVGRPVKAAQRRMVELLRESGDLIGEPRPVRHPVKFWENGTKPLEIVTSNQWFIKYPPRDDMLRRGRELKWWPEFMRVRYENWVNGLIGDWNITRQRFFGVPFPAWYPIGADGTVDRSKAVVDWNVRGLQAIYEWEAIHYLGYSRRWRDIPKPSIAAVQGACIAGGLMLCWPCDLIVASEDAKFSDPVVRMGIGGVEYHAHTWELGARKAKELLFTARSMTATEAERLGMVNRVVAREDLESETMALAAEIAEMHPFALAQAKRAVNQTVDVQGFYTALQAVFDIHQTGHGNALSVGGYPVLVNLDEMKRASKQS